MATLEILSQDLARRLLLADTTLEEQVIWVRAPIYSVQLHRLHTLAEELAEASEKKAVRGSWGGIRASEIKKILYNWFR